MQKRTETLPSGLAFDLIRVEGDTFRMGSPEGTPDSDSDEHPDHDVRVSSFFIGQYPVTQTLWETIMGNNPSNFLGANRPVEKVSWYDAVAFCNRLSRDLELSPCYYADERFTKTYALEGPLPNSGPVYFNPKAGGFRLPTEAEWEFAARGGKYSEGYKYGGSDRLKQVGWYGENSGDETHEVGLLYPNELGLYDMSGNVREWCEDWYDSNYYKECESKGLEVDPKGPNKGASRVRRGGSWSGSAQYCRVASRYSYDPGYRRIYYYGFRLALSL